MSDNFIAMGTVTLGCLVLAAGQFDNHLWRLMCIYASSSWILPQLELYTSQPWVLRTIVSLAVSAALMYIPHLRSKHARSGCVVVTGCDSGMGQATVLYLAETNTNSSSKNGSYDKIFAACFNAKAAQSKLEELIKDKAQMKFIQVIQLDATKDASVQQAAKTVRDYLKESKSYLAGVLCYHGIAYNGPLAYMPLEMYQTQMEVNFFGNVRMVQSFLPLLQSRENTTSSVRRMIFTGTGGGPCSPCPSLLRYVGKLYQNCFFSL